MFDHAGFAIWCALVVSMGAAALVRVWRAPSVRPLCGSCRYRAETICRRNPPRPVYTGSPEINTTAWPIVRPEMDWCGEHRPC